MNTYIRAYKPYVTRVTLKVTTCWLLQPLPHGPFLSAPSLVLQGRGLPIKAFHWPLYHSAILGHIFLLDKVRPWIQPILDWHWRHIPVPSPGIADYADLAFLLALHCHVLQWGWGLASDHAGAWSSTDPWLLLRNDDCENTWALAINELRLQYDFEVHSGSEALFWTCLPKGHDHRLQLVQGTVLETDRLSHVALHQDSKDHDEPKHSKSTTRSTCTAIRLVQKGEDLSLELYWTHAFQTGWNYTLAHVPRLGHCHFVWNTLVVHEWTAQSTLGPCSQRDLWPSRNGSVGLNQTIFLPWSQHSVAIPPRWTSSTSTPAGFW